jgi:tetratricopeptide (TPR) repeat protein
MPANFSIFWALPVRQAEISCLVPSQALVIHVFFRCGGSSGPIIHAYSCHNRSKSGSRVTVPDRAGPYNAGGWEHSRLTNYSRQDVCRIFQISPHQLLGWVRAGLIPHQQNYTFQELGQLRTLRALREKAIPAASIRHSIVAMKAVSGMANPLLEASLVRTGTRLAFRHGGAMVDPIRRQFLFDFERLDRLDRMDRMGHPSALSEPAPLRPPGVASPRGVQDRFLAAVQAEESGDKQRAMVLYEEILGIDPLYAAAYINLGTINFHLRNYDRAEELYRRATEVDPGYVLAFFDLGNVLDELQRPDESIAAYCQAVSLSPRYADAHYNLALAYERKGERRKALRHWHRYVKLDHRGPWADHARGQIRKLLSQEGLSIAGRAESFVPPCKGMAALELIAREVAKER